MAKPVVDRIETQLDGKAKVIRLDVTSSVGKEAAVAYGVRGVPSLLVVDGNGNTAYGLYGVPMPGTVVEEVDKLLVTTN